MCTFTVVDEEEFEEIIKELTNKTTARWWDGTHLKKKPLFEIYPSSELWTGEISLKYCEGDIGIDYWPEGLHGEEFNTISNSEFVELMKKRFPLKKNLKSIFRTKRIKKLDEVPEATTLYCFDEAAPEEIDKVYIKDDARGYRIIIFEPLSYYDEIEVDITLSDEDPVETYSSLVFVALNDKQMRKCESFYSWQKMTDTRLKLGEVQNGNQL